MPRSAQRLDQGVDLAGGDTAGVGLHHHGVEGLVEPAAWLEPVGEEAALSQPGNGQGEVTHLGGEQPLAVAVAVGGPFVRAALVDLGANGSGHPGFQQILETPPHDLRDQGASGGTLHELSQLGTAIWERLMVCVRFGGGAPNRVTDRPTHCHR